jgi:hypothetical protein
MDDSKTLAILLPAAFPDLSYIARCLNADHILLHDTLPFSRKSRVHRGRIRTPDGVQWIHLPIHPEDRDKPLHKARIENPVNWLPSQWRAIEYNYRNSIFFDHYEPEIIEDFDTISQMHLYTDATSYLNHRLWKYLQLPAETCPNTNWSSIATTKPSHMTSVKEISPTEIAQLLEFEAVFQEEASKNYHQPTKQQMPFAFEHPVYRQHFGGFEKECCALDLLFELGPNAWKVLEKLTIR